MVFIVVQNLVGINAVVFIICMFFDFACLAWKCLFALLELGFKVFDSINGELYQRNPQKAHPCAERCRTTPRLLDWSTSATCACDEETTKERNLIVAKRYESNHPCRWIEIKFCMVSGLQEIVLSFDFCQKRLSSFRDVGSLNSPYPITLAIGLYNSLS